MIIHKRKFPKMCYTLCGTYNHIGPNGNKWLEWKLARYKWKYVTCKECLKKRKI